jgi:zona occludens toxin
MFTLITGAPGAGKTALALHMLLTEGKGRLLLVDGVKDLSIPHEKLPPLAQWTHEVDDPDSMTGRKLVFDFPADSIILIDEAQRVYRPRSNGAAVPAYVAALETHRHGGHDVWMVTQNPGLVDANVRKLVNRHIHVRCNLMGGRKLYEWADEVGEVENRASRELAAKRSYKLPRAVFGLYTSAVAHTKLKRRVPMYVYVGVGAVLLAAGFGWRAYRSMSDKLVEPAASGGVGAVGAGGGAGVKSSAAAGVPAVSWADSQRPRVAGLPHTAPVFDSVTAPKSAPFPSACIRSASKGCLCFTDQATLLPVEHSVCEQIVATGFYEASRDRPRADVVSGVSEPRKASAVVVARSEPIPTPAVIDYTFSGSHVGGARSAPAAPASAAPVVAPVR